MRTLFLVPNVTYLYKITELRTPVIRTGSMGPNGDQNMDVPLYTVISIKHMFILSLHVSDTIETQLYSV